MTDLTEDDRKVLRATQRHGDPYRAAKRGPNPAFAAQLNRLVHAGLLRTQQVELDGAPFNTLALTPRGSAVLGA